MGGAQRPLAGDVRLPRWAFAPGRREKGRIFIGGKTLFDLASWDVLAVNEEPSILRAVQAEVVQLGIGSRSSRAWGGSADVHIKCETRLAKFLLGERALLFSSRAQALTSVIGTFFSRGGVLFVERSSRRLLQDVAVMVGVELREFSYERPAALAAELGIARRDGPVRIGVFIETIADDRAFVPDINELQQICATHGARFFVDESSVLGLVGLRGAGGLDLAAVVEDCGQVVVSSLGRGFGGYGAVVAGPSLLLDEVELQSTTTMIEVAPPPILSFFSLVAVDYVERAAGARAQIHRWALELATAATAIGLDVESDRRSPIVDIRCESRELVVELHKFLFSRGVFSVILGVRVRLICGIFFNGEALQLIQQAFGDFKAIRDRFP